MSQQKLLSSFKQIYNSFEQRDRKSACPIAQGQRPHLPCSVAELFSVGLTVTDLDLHYFCSGLKFHFLLIDFQVTHPL